MSTNEKIVIGIIVIILSSSFWSGCITQTPPITVQNFEIHEWGVFLKEYNCTNTSVLTKPPDTIYVKKPVIYFHSIQNATDLTVKISSITNTTVIPNALKGENTIRWDILVEHDTIVLQNGTYYPYLFYEGEINCSSAIISTIIRHEGNATFYVKNMENYTITNVFVLYFAYHDFVSTADDQVECIYFGDLQPQEEKTIINTSLEQVINKTNARNILHNAFISDGLTLNESNELLSNWETYWFAPSNIGIHTRVIYMIPQSLYDQLLPISITPEPSRIQRTGIFTITDIPVVILPP